MFLDTTWVSAQFYTDASGSKGYGAYFAGAWLRGDWQPHQRLPQRSIQWQEMFAIMAASTTWAQRLPGKRICFCCNNQAIVKSWQRKSVKHPQIADLLQRLFTSTDTCTRQREQYCRCFITQPNVTFFFSLAPQANRQPTPIPFALTQL